jgi:pseudouridine kinase
MLESMKDYWVCAGGANVDVQGITSAGLLPGTSNPGTVRQTAGGVARNVADHLARLGEEVLLFALVGEDAEGEWLRQTTAQSGVATNGMVRVPGCSTGRYLAIRGADGELFAAVSDMAVNEAWTEQMVEDGVKRLQQASGLFLDANLPQPVIRRFVEEGKRLGKPVAAAPVSVKKAERWRGLLDGVKLIVTGTDELEVLTGQPMTSADGVETAARLLLNEGIDQVMVLCGGNGLYLCRQTESLWLPQPACQLRETAKDAFAAGVLFALGKTESLAEQAAFGVAVAELAADSLPFDPEALQQRTAAYAARARDAVGRE